MFEVCVLDVVCAEHGVDDVLDADAGGRRPPPRRHIRRPIPHHGHCHTGCCGTRYIATTSSFILAVVLGILLQHHHPFYWV